MKNFIENLLFGKNRKATAVLIGVIFLTFGLGCGLLKEKREPVPTEYKGIWEGENGEILKIYENGKGDYTTSKADDNVINTRTNCLYYIPKENKLVCEDGTEILQTYSIDAPPKKGRMKLSGEEFFLEEDLNEKQKPSDKELLKLAGDTIFGINEGIQNKNFEDFHKEMSRRAQRNMSKDKLSQMFQPFIEKKYDFKAIKNASGEIKNAELSNFGVRSTLEIEGFFDTNPRTIFNFTYIWQEDEWKLVQVNHFGTDS